MERHHQQAPPDALVLALHPRLVVGRDHELEGRRELELLAEQVPDRQRFAAGDLLDRALRQLRAALGLRRHDQAHAGQARQIGRGFRARPALVLKERGDRQRRRVVAQNPRHVLDQGRLAVRPGAVAHEHHLFGDEPGQTVAHEPLNERPHRPVRLDRREEALPLRRVGRRAIAGAGEPGDQVAPRMGRQAHVGRAAQAQGAVGDRHRQRIGVHRPGRHAEIGLGVLQGSLDLAVVAGAVGMPAQGVERVLVGAGGGQGVDLPAHGPHGPVEPDPGLRRAVLPVPPPPVPGGPVALGDVDQVPAVPGDQPLGIAQVAARLPRELQIVRLSAVGRRRGRPDRRLPARRRPTLRRVAEGVAGGRVRPLGVVSGHDRPPRTPFALTPRPPPSACR